jgi:hypothetical protein
VSALGRWLLASAALLVLDAATRPACALAAPAPAPRGHEDLEDVLAAADDDALGGIPEDDER